jgi:hypothetical protein
MRRFLQKTQVENFPMSACIDTTSADKATNPTATDSGEALYVALLADTATHTDLKARLFAINRQLIGSGPDAMLRILRFAGDMRRLRTPGPDADLAEHVGYACLLRLEPTMGARAFGDLLDEVGF